MVKTRRARRGSSGSAAASSTEAAEEEDEEEKAEDAVVPERRTSRRAAAVVAAAAVSEQSLPTRITSRSTAETIAAAAAAGMKGISEDALSKAAAWSENKKSPTNGNDTTSTTANNSAEKAASSGSNKRGWKKTTSRSSAATSTSEKTAPEPTGRRSSRLRSTPEEDKGKEKEAPAPAPVAAAPSKRGGRKSVANRKQEPTLEENTENGHSSTTLQETNMKENNTIPKAAEEKEHKEKPPPPPPPPEEPKPKRRGGWPKGKPRRKSPRSQAEAAAAASVSASAAPPTRRTGGRSSRSNSVSRGGAPVAGYAQPNGDSRQFGDDDEEDDAVDANVPMKEIRLLPPSAAAGPIKMPDDLDDNTLGIVKNHLVGNYDPRTKLGDDEVVAFMLRMDRQTHQQAEHQKILVGDMGASHASEIYEDILAEEEEHALGREFYHEMISQIHEAHGGRARHRHSPHYLDKRSLGWIRKAAGLHRGAVGDAARSESNSTNQANAPSSIRRYTRGMAKHTRKARVERGLSSLTAAANQIDKEFGPFIVKRPQPPPKRSRAFFPEDDDFDDGRRSKKRHKGASAISADDYKNLSKKERKKLKRRERELMEIERAERVMAELRDGNSDGDDDDSEDDDGPFYSSPTRLRDGSRSPSPGKRVVFPEPESAPLRLHDWMRRERIMVEGRDSMEITAKPKDDVRLPSSYKKSGITHQVPPWTKVCPRAVSDRNQAHYPPRRRHEDSVYASLCDKLMKQLAGKARSRIRYEFFYSDLDKQWYNRNEFVRAAAKLGVPPGSLLTRREWAAVRKRIPNKPRLFSKRFIASQMSERNKYRNSLRMLQNDPNPDLARRLGFDYEVPARIPIGAVVTVFNSRYRMLERGVVLSYEEARGKYFVKLPYSNHFCSDFDVARHGLASIIMPAPDMVLGDMERKLEFGFTHSERLLQHNTAIGPVQEPTGEPRMWTVDDEIRGLFDCKPSSLSKPGKRTTVTPTPKEALSAPTEAERVAEYEMLVSVMISLEMAMERKRMILDSLEAMHSLAGSNGRLPDHVHKHYPWLLANLDSTNKVLSTAHSCLQNLYGNVYLPASRVSMGRFDILESMLGQKLSSRDYCGGQDEQQRMGDLSYGDELGEDDERQNTINTSACQRSLFGGAADQWLTRLLLDSEDIGGKVVATELKLHDKSDEHTQFLHDRVYDISRLLLALSYGREEASGPRRDDSTAMNAAVAVAQNEVTALTFPPAPSIAGDEDADVYTDTLTARNLAMDDLKSALEFLNAEHTAVSLQASLRSTSR